jgi:hypothetical protein
MDLYKATADVSKWSPAMREKLDPVYGSTLQPLWSVLLLFIFIFDWAVWDI